MISKKIIIPIFALALLGSGALLKVSLVHAATSTSPQSGLVQYLAQKLGLDQSKVQTVFDEYRTQERTDRQQKMTENYTVYLDGLIKQSKITEAQKAALLAKHTEFQKTRQSTDWSTKTPEERRTAVEQQRTDLETWAKQQGIDVNYLQFGFGRGTGKGRGMHADF